MGVTVGQAKELANQCEAKADQLLSIQETNGFSDPDEATLSQNESTLRAKVLALNTATVDAALANSAEAQSQLQQAITTTKNVTLDINDVKNAIQISGDLIALATGVLSANPGAVIRAAIQVAKDATAQAQTASRVSGGSA